MLVGGSSGQVEGSVDFLARTANDRVSAPLKAEQTDSRLSGVRY